MEIRFHFYKKTKRSDMLITPILIGTLFHFFNSSSIVNMVTKSKLLYMNVNVELPISASYSFKFFPIRFEKRIYYKYENLFIAANINIFFSIILRDNILIKRF